MCAPYLNFFRGFEYEPTALCAILNVDLCYEEARWGAIVQAFRIERDQKVRERGVRAACRLTMTVLRS